MSNVNVATFGNSLFRDKEHLIIEEPKLQSLKQRYGQKTLAFIGWAGWLYLLLPLLNMVGWFFGIQLFYEKIVIQGDKVQLTALIIAYVILITVVLNMIAGWALYHIWRFAGKERRKLQPPASVEDMSRYFHVKSYRVPEWQHAKRMTLYLNDKGLLETVDTLGEEVRRAAQRLG